MNAKWTSDDVPGQHGRLAVVTGANTGLGFETARVLAARGASMVLAVRDIEKGKHAAAGIVGTAPGADAMVQPLDLASLDSIRAAADQLRAQHEHQPIGHQACHRLARCQPHHWRPHHHPARAARRDRRVAPGDPMTGLPRD